MRRAYRLLAGLLAAGALLTTTAGCAQSVAPIERLGRKAAQKVTHPGPSPTAGPQTHPHGDRGDRSGRSDRRDRGGHGGHGASGALVVIACPQPPESRHAWLSPPLRHWWPDRPGSSEGVEAGAGCERR